MRFYGAKHMIVIQTRKISIWVNLGLLIAKEVLKCKRNKMRIHYQEIRDGHESDNFSY